MTAARVLPTQSLRSQHSLDNDAKASSSMGARLESTDLFRWMETCATEMFSSCEGNCAVPSATRQSPARNNSRNDALQSLDFANLHDHFLEALLREASTRQTDLETASSTSTSSMGDDSDSFLLQRKRRRRLNRATSEPSKRGEPMVRNLLPTSTNLPPPTTFLHANVRLQKDKGRGEDPGSNICAKGHQGSLEKLRAKMELLCSTAMQEKGASMKRRPARVWCHDTNFVETRSTIEIRLGFLSMMYGILLRWDTNVTGKITLVVLRKMCQESFYPAMSAVPSLGSTSSSSTEDTDLQPPLSGHTELRLAKQHNASADNRTRSLEPPYQVPRPKEFTPSIFSVHSISATGLDSKADYSIHFAMDSKLQAIDLVYIRAAKSFSPQGWNGLRHHLSSLDVTVEVKVIQVRSNRRRCISTMQIPMSHLPAQSQPRTHLTLPCNGARIEMDVSLESSSMEWVKKELAARRKEPRQAPIRRCHSPPVTPPLLVETDDDEDEEEDPWGWILCYMC